MRVARRRLPLKCQRMERRTRPPSRGERGDHVERDQHGVDQRQVGHHAEHGLGQPHPLAGQMQPPSAESDCEAHGRAGDRDPELRLGAGHLARHLGHTAEKEQRDPPHGDAEAPGHQRVGQLVHHDRGEEEQGARDPHPPVGGARQSRVLGGERLVGQVGCGEHGHDEPARVEADRESEEGEEVDTASEHGAMCLHEGCRSPPGRANPCAARPGSGGRAGAPDPRPRPS